MWSVFGVLFFFFFQAEDGIRDADVTGVQTCALPIFIAEYGQDGTGVNVITADSGSQLIDEETGSRFLILENGARFDGTPGRSEERRVGKECRSRWWREH